MRPQSVDLDAKLQELDRLKSRTAELEKQISEATQQPPHWRAKGYYTAFYATTGFMLGSFAAAASLLVNVIGAPIVGKNPLELIRVYLTFPLGESALRLTEQPGHYVLGDGVILAIGCCLYLFTGMLLGVPFFLVLTRFTARASLGVRLIVAAALSIAVWLFNFYAVLSWLQPLLFGGHWITDPKLLPPWVAMATHLVFGWTLVLLYPLGEYVPYRRPTEK
jgi:hypothetical protein